MSGGHFGFLQHRISGTADDIREIIESNRYDYSDETIARFNEAADTLFRAAIMLKHVDYLVCEDTGEESFHKRWEEEL